MRKLVVTCLATTMLVSGGALPAGAGDTVASGRVESAAVAPPPAGTLQLQTVHLDGARSFARTGSTLWVELGTISAYTATGQALGNVPGVDGSTQIAANPSGTVLYSAAWHDDSISAIDPATRSVVHHWSTFACPLSMVESAGYLLYSYGCSEQNAGVAALDLSSGRSVRLIGSTVLTYLALAGGTLAVATPTLLATYHVQGSTLTPIATRAVNAWKMVMAPDGSELLASIMVDHTVTTAQRLRTSDLVTLRTVKAERDLTAVAWAPDGSTYAVGLGVQATGDLVQVYSAADDRLVSRSVWPGARWPDTYEVYHLSYSPTSRLIHGFGNDNFARFLTASTEPGVAVSLSMTRTSPKFYGKPLLARVSATNCSPCAVRFTLKDTVAGTRTFTRTVTSTTPLNLSLPVQGNGTLSATIPGSLRRVQVTRTQTYGVPLRMGLRMTGSPKKSGSVLVYTKRPTLKVAVAPGRKVRLVELRYTRFDGKWTKTGHRIVSTNAAGVLYAKPVMGNGDLTRMKYVFEGDTKHARAVVRGPLFRWR